MPETSVRPSTLPTLDPVPEVAAALERVASEYLSAEQVARVRRAYLVSAAAHDGQTRKSGEPYITHPLAVSSLLAELRLDCETLCAAILHDTLEDTGLGHAALSAEFGEAVAELVEGVTKLDKLQFRDRYEAAAESFRKMMLAMARDLRVILIKLADRLHNMRTIDSMSPGSRRRIAAETLEIYAPIAQRLGMNRIKAELQDLGFAALHPRRHAVIRRRIQSQPVLRRESMASIEAALAQKLANEKISHRLVGRVKSPYSVYQKMRGEHKSFDQVMDVFGFRVIVKSVMECYHALGAVHSLYKPLDGRFRDFIAIPKANGYQSLHTVLFGPFGSPIEVQIRTEDMDLIAERGIAAHWMYKSGERTGTGAQLRAQDWLRDLLESQAVAGSPMEFLENVKVDLFPDEVYLFTPKGDIRALPRNATALDFAYAVHTDVGDHAVAARVDKKLVPLRTRLVSGQSVEIITAPSATPHPSWLEFVVSSKARTAIRHFLKHLQHEDAVELGHRMLDRALGALQFSLDRVEPQRLEQYLVECRFRRLEELLADIALGNRMPQQVAVALTQAQGDDSAPEPQAPLDVERILITGAERGVLSFANCCHPVPGDQIMGYLTAGKGIVVHRLECSNLPEFRKSPERWVSIGWDRSVQGEYRAGLRVEVENKPGVLAQVAAAIAEAQSNIDNVEYQERDLRMAIMHFNIEVRSRKHLADVIRRVRRLAVAHGVQRL
ncbi:RelA/SpoT family protein [Pseudomarimonas arenosa]|uniref:guanosine-3',5'-bis(diphosphate) 3'-diphosphatase n=1 Tax=Pseudomarimonas arenosa TaxID=2774145 RepID=A0AAW3ZIP6_9GAMM|nr:bifunctional (p)ppGpp synthetase/guanosine-3',5'-bis(diphosphate) 3'-pyrophosphohydrolase [Pseudomarimonas arenosa]MBD8525012.1 bifunctional (p)ppGpp synthetase/guanosine-3',5'-bis(diphosphate) 3'-pyrophosphohydrolase [Pseudomarimonas arenosa]